MRSLAPPFILAATAVIAAPSAIAQQPVNSATGVSLFPGGSVLRSRIEIRPLDGDGRLPDVTTRLVPTTLSYGAGTDLTLGLTLPWAEREIELSAGDTKFRGLADMFATAKYRYFVTNFPGGTVQLAALGGISLPTGETDARGPTGQLLPVPMQLGSGSTDYVAALTATGIFRNNWAAHASLLYQLNTEGERDVRLGDFVNYNLAVSRSVYRAPYPGPQVYLGLELNGEYNERDRRGGATIPDTGGNRIFASPTLVAFLNRNWTLEASVQVPVHGNLNGRQPEAETRYVLGFRFQYATFAGD